MVMMLGQQGSWTTCRSVMDSRHNMHALLTARKVTNLKCTPKLSCPAMYMDNVWMEQFHQQMCLKVVCLVNMLC